VSPSSTSNSEPSSERGEGPPVARAGFPRAALLALLLVLAAEACLRWVVRDGHSEYPRIWHSQEVSRKLELAAAAAQRSGGKFECVFLGDSRAETGLSPALLAAHGHSAFNFALAGVTMPFQVLLLHRFVLPRYAPKLIVWGVSVREFASSDPSLQSSTDLFMNSPAARALGGNLVDSWIGLNALESIALLGYRANLHAWMSVRFADEPERAALLRRWDLNADQCQAIRRRGQFMPRGTFAFDPLGQRLITKHLDRGQTETERLALRVGADWVDAFGASLAHCEELGVAVVVVNLPSAKGYGEGPQAGALEEYQTAVQNVCRLHHVDYFDLHDPTGSEYPDELFGDYIHLNTDGAHRLTERVLELIASRLQ